MQTSPAPAIVAGGAYQPVVLHAGIAYVSGQLPRQHGELRWTGKVGSELDLEQARQAARLCAARCLQALEEALGGLQRVERLLKVTGYVARQRGGFRPAAGGDRCRQRIFRRGARRARRPRPRRRRRGRAAARRRGGGGTDRGGAAMSALFPAAPDAFGADELLRLRRETPAWGSYAHFAHGSASLPPQVLYDALDSWLEAERRWGVQRAAEHFAEPLLAVRDSVARVLGTQPRHIALLDCASRAWSVAFAAALAAHPRIRAISSFDEYGSNSLCLLAARQQRGLELRLIDARGDAAQLLQRLDEQLHDLAPGQTPLLSLSAVPTGHGAATALEGVAERIRAHDGLFFLDASHAVGQLPLAVEAIGCDVLVFPPRKWLRGPKGLGVLYLGERALERLALPDGLDVGGAQWSDAFALQARDDARRFECSEFNPGLRLALKASCDYLLQTDVQRIARRNRQLRERIAQQLYRRLGWTPLEQGPHASALMTYAAPELSGEQWLKRLHARGVNASYIGPQYARWALREQALPGVLRLTPHYLTDDSEIERLGEALEDCLRQRAAS